MRTDFSRRASAKCALDEEVVFDEAAVGFVHLLRVIAPVGALQSGMGYIMKLRQVTMTTM
ncbi:MAG: hypothetical protein RMK99_14045 [Anaerolineales bacterium]|nr:hypothetical protein [Anaerolineales bacterium]